jgi:1,4-alpha-glucan branching enzyme
MSTIFAQTIKIYQKLLHIAKTSSVLLHIQKNLFSLPHNSKNEIVMSIKKQFVKTKPVCKVTFSVEAKEATTASVVGEFNNWDQAAGELSKLKNGTFKGVFELPKDASYEFKYVIDGNFVNEPEADSFKWNDFAGTENGVINV